MTRRVLITGATGSIGGKLATHFRAAGGYDLRLLCRNPLGVPGVVTADLSHWNDDWAAEFAGVDTVIHLAGEPSPRAPWETVQPLNIDLLLNVLEASRRHRVRRVVFASSNWVMAGYRFGTERLTTDLPPRPINPYGQSKLFGERAGLSLAARTGISFIAFRIGWCRREPGNRPRPDMSYGTWGQLMWLSDRDLCQAMERAVLAEGVSTAVLNLMSDNPGMRWDIETTKRVIGYVPRDGQAAIMDEASRQAEDMAERSRTLSQQLEQFVMRQNW
jgi:NAD(P)-dependent dehydrogenase (short-subunit alcohol dehydrogenase family)